MISSQLAVAYHGCDHVVARKIVLGQTDFLPSRKEYDWLGSGIYFWEDSAARAMRWARDASGKAVRRPAVVGSLIDLGNCLNLTDVAHLELVRAAHAVYLNLCKQSGALPARNRGAELRARYLDRAVFETLHQLRKEQGEPPFDTVRAFFVEGAPLYETSGLRGLDHIQICVRDPTRIIGCFLPRPQSET